MATVKKVPKELMGGGGAPTDQSLPPELGGEATPPAEAPPTEQPAEQPTGGTVQVSIQEMPQLDGAKQGDKFVAEILTDNGDGTFEVGYAADQTI